MALGIAVRRTFAGTLVHYDCLCHVADGARSELGAEMRFAMGSRQGQGERFGRRLERLASEPLPDVPGAAQPPRVPARVPAIVVGALAEHALLPDLLNPVPTLTVDAAQLRGALAFSFIAEDDGGVLAHALDSAPLAASDFDPEC